MEEISKKESILGIAAAFIIIAIAVIIHQPIRNKMTSNAERYSQALKIYEDSDQFLYAEKTNVGDTLAYGEFVALQKQSIPELINEYGEVIRKTEKYTMHTRLVCTTTNNHTTCRTETYWTWDNIKTDRYESAEYSFLGHIFSNNDINLPSVFMETLNESTVSSEYIENVYGSHIYKMTVWNTRGDIRYGYYILPKKFNGSLFVRFFNDLMTNPIHKEQKLEIFYEKTIDNVLIEQDKNLVVFDIVYYIFFVFIGIGLYFLLAYQVLEI